MPGAMLLLPIVQVEVHGTTVPMMVLRWAAGSCDVACGDDHEAADGDTEGIAASG